MKNLLILLTTLFTIEGFSQNIKQIESVTLRPDTVVNSLTNEGTNNPVVHGYSVDTTKTNPIYSKHFTFLFVTYEQKQITNKGKLKK